MLPPPGSETKPTNEHNKEEESRRKGKKIIIINVNFVLGKRDLPSYYACFLGFIVCVCLWTGGWTQPRTPRTKQEVCAWAANRPTCQPPGQKWTHICDMCDYAFRETLSDYYVGFTLLWGDVKEEEVQHHVQNCGWESVDIFIIKVSFAYFFHGTIRCNKDVTKSGFICQEN